MPFARIDLIKGKTPEYRAAVADIVYMGIVDVLKSTGRRPLHRYQQAHGREPDL